MSTISKMTTFYTSICSAHDKLLLGTERGTVHVYHMASLEFIAEVPYQLGHLSNFSLNDVDKLLKARPNQYAKSYGHFTQVNKDVEDLNAHKLGPQVKNIFTTHNMRFLCIKYEDSSFVVIDRTIQDARQAILGYQFGHFEKVSGLQWVISSKKSKRHKASLALDTQYMQMADDRFVTCSHDLSVFVWKHFGDRWSFSYIDIAKCFDNQLSYQRKNMEKST